MRFVLCANGDLVNLDHVASVTDAANGMQALKGADGRVLGVTAEDTDSMLSQVIPAAGRVTGVILTFDRGEPDKDIRIDRVPVIAWRVYPEGDPTPILASEPLSNQRVLVELPDDRVLVWSGGENWIADSLPDAVENFAAAQRKAIA